MNVYYWYAVTTKVLLATPSHILFDDDRWVYIIFYLKETLYDSPVYTVS